MGDELYWDIMRFYPTPIGELPSVTSILAATESANAKARLAQWNKENSDNEFSPRHRGAFVDNLLSSLLSLPPSVRVDPIPELCPEPYRPWVESLVTPLKATGVPIYRAIGECVWVQGLIDGSIPKEKRYFYTRSDGVTQEYVFSHSGRYAGVPDFIGQWNGKLSLISLKTSGDLYSSIPPDWKAIQQEKKLYGKSSQASNDSISRYMRFHKASLQETAYRIALQECLGIHVEQIVIIVVSSVLVKDKPRPPQVFTLKQWALDKAAQEWQKRLAKFWSTYQENVA